MKEFLQSIKLNVLFSAVFSIILGIVLIMHPAEVTVLVCRIVGIVLIIMGVTIIISSLVSSTRLPLAGGIVIALIGLFIYLNPEAVVSLIPAFIGVIMIIHAIEDLRLAATIISNRSQGAPVVILFGIITLALGILCICAAFEIVSLAVIIIGISLVFDGISDIFVVRRVSSAMRNAYQEASAIDTTYEER